MASFSAKAKAEASVKERKNECCEKACIFGMLLFSGRLSESSVSYTTETPESAALLSSYFESRFGFLPVREEALSQKGDGRITLSFSEREQTQVILSHFGITDAAFSLDDFSLSAEDAVCRSLVCTDCERSFIAGAFLACGFVYPPEKKYQAEFVMRDKELRHILEGLLCRRRLPPKKTTRRDRCVLYLQGAEKVSDLLGMVGATGCYFDILNTQAVRETAEAAVRTTNFEIANMKKTTDASYEQVRAIELLMKTGKFDLLPAALRQTAKNRLAHPESTLSELAEMENPPVSKSQISKRLSRIAEFAAEPKA